LCLKFCVSLTPCSSSSALNGKMANIKYIFCAKFHSEGSYYRIHKSCTRCEPPLRLYFHQIVVCAVLPPSTCTTYSAFQLLRKHSTNTSVIASHKGGTRRGLQHLHLYLVCSSVTVAWMLHLLPKASYPRQARLPISALQPSSPTPLSNQGSVVL
jgi:hypothetical protein